MKRAAAVIVCLALRFAFAGGPAGCGSGTLGGNAGSPPGTGIGGRIMSSIGSGGIGGDIGPPQGGSGQGGFTTGAGGRGRGGTIGSGGSGVGGSVVCPYLEPPPPVCGPAQCGNGVVDTCTTMPPPGCDPQSFTEPCDGTDFGGDSCALRGLASGNLLCNSDCTVDATLCSPCVLGPSTLRCGPAPVTTPDAIGFALAATDSEAAYAMVTYDQSGTGQLWFTRLSPSLDATSVIIVDDTSQPGDMFGNTFFAAAAAPLASGWVVAVCSDFGLYIHRFDANGQDAGRTTVASSSANSPCGYTTPVLAARPGGEVLLAWPTATGVNTTVIAADGRSFTTPQAIVETDPLAFSFLTAAWVGDRFYLGVPIFADDPTGTTVDSVHIVRVATDGGTDDFGVYFLQFYTEPTIAAGAGDLRLTYNGSPPGGVASGIVWERIAPNHAELTPVLLGAYPYSGRSPTVAFGDDTVVLMGTYELQALGLARVGLDGTVVTPVHDILEAPFYSFSAWDMVRRGPDVIVGWKSWDGSQPIGLARITP